MQPRRSRRHEERTKKTPAPSPKPKAWALAARGETPAAFGRRCIPSGCVAPRSNTPGILARRALPAGRIAAPGATLDFHHGLLAEADRPPPPPGAQPAPAGPRSLLGPLR